MHVTFLKDQLTIIVVFKVKKTYNIYVGPMKKCGATDFLKSKLPTFSEAHTHIYWKKIPTALQDLFFSTSVPCASIPFSCLTCCIRATDWAGAVCVCTVLGCFNKMRWTGELKQQTFFSFIVEWLTNNHCMCLRCTMWGFDGCMQQILLTVLEAADSGPGECPLPGLQHFCCVPPMAEGGLPSLPLLLTRLWKFHPDDFT